VSHSSQSQGGRERFIIAPAPPHGLPRDGPPVAIRDASELTANASKLHHVTVPQQTHRLPVQPPDAIMQGRSNLKHTSAAQERRIQQQQQQQQQQSKPAYGRTLLKQTSQFDRLVDVSRSPSGGGGRKQLHSQASQPQPSSPGMTSRKVATVTPFAPTSAPQRDHGTQVRGSEEQRASHRHSSPAPAPGVGNGGVASRVEEDEKRSSLAGNMLFRAGSNTSDMSGRDIAGDTPSGFGARATGEWQLFHPSISNPAPCCMLHLIII
jgi:hypothetical protein